MKGHFLDFGLRFGIDCSFVFIHPKKVKVAFALLEVGTDFVGRCSWTHFITGAHCILLERETGRITGAECDRQELLQ